MKVRPPRTDRLVELHGSQRAYVLPILHKAGKWHIVLLRIEPAGVLGMHQASADQLLAVVAGSGVVRTPAEMSPVQPGSIVTWIKGEEHETSAGPEGLIAVIVEGDGLQLALVNLER